MPLTGLPERSAIIVVVKGVDNAVAVGIEVAVVGQLVAETAACRTAGGIAVQAGAGQVVADFGQVGQIVDLDQAVIVQVVVGTTAGGKILPGNEQKKSGQNHQRQP